MQSQTDTHRLRRDLRGMLVLEVVQRTIAIGTLVAIALYAAFSSSDALTSAVLVSFVILALLHLGQAFRLRAGANLLRRDLYAAESALGDGNERGALAAGPLSDGPYRSAPLEPAVVAARRRCVPWVRFVGHAVVTAALTGAAFAALH